jgi:organic hydroperoxide reductase OsmC/OhrA
MSEHTIELSWARNGGPFERGNYGRDHSVRFEGGQVIRNSAATDYGGEAGASNPEELLLAALSSCHMLTFLAVAANRGYVVENYTDHATALLEKNADGKMAVTHATLAPQVQFGGEKQPSAEDYAKMQERAHAACFIANSVKTVVEVRL